MPTRKPKSRKAASARKAVVVRRKATPAKRPQGRPSTSGTVVGPEALIEVACELLRRHPPGEITRALVAREARVDPALIRYYFQNRDSLMRMAAETLTQKLQQRGAAAAERADLAPFERISARARALLAFKVENPFYHRVMMEEVALSADPQSRALYLDIAARAIERYRGYLRAGVADGSLRPVDPAFLYIAIVGLCDFFVIAAPVLAPLLGEQDPQQLMSRYADFIGALLLHGLAADGD